MYDQISIMRIECLIFKSREGRSTSFSCFTLWILVVQKSVCCFVNVNGGHSMYIKRHFVFFDFIFVKISFIEEKSVEKLVLIYIVEQIYD